MPQATLPPWIETLKQRDPEFVASYMSQREKILADGAIPAKYKHLMTMIVDALLAACRRRRDHRQPRAGGGGLGGGDPRSGGGGLPVRRHAGPGHGGQRVPHLRGAVTAVFASARCSRHPPGHRIARSRIVRAWPPDALAATRRADGRP